MEKYNTYIIYILYTIYNIYVISNIYERMHLQKYFVQFLKFHCRKKIAYVIQIFFFVTIIILSNHITLVCQRQISV